MQSVYHFIQTNFNKQLDLCVIEVAANQINCVQPLSTIKTSKSNGISVSPCTLFYLLEYYLFRDIRDF